MLTSIVLLICALDYYYLDAKSSQKTKNFSSQEDLEEYGNENLSNESDRSTFSNNLTLLVDEKNQTTTSIHNESVIVMTTNSVALNETTTTTMTSETSKTSVTTMLMAAIKSAENSTTSTMTSTVIINASTTTPTTTASLDSKIENSDEKNLTIPKTQGISVAMSLKVSNDLSHSENETELIVHESTTEPATTTNSIQIDEEKEDLKEEPTKGEEEQKEEEETTTTTTTTSSQLQQQQSTDPAQPVEKWHHCGLAHVKPSIKTDLLGRRLTKRIVGGEDAVQDSWPFLVSVRIKLKKSLHHCGGTLITDEYVLTAAHCIFAYLKVAHDMNLNAKSIMSLIEIQVGLYEHDTENVPEDHIYRVKWFDFHNRFSFNDWTLENDVAIFRLDRKINLNRPEVNVACLPRQQNRHLHRVETNDRVVVVGWGSFAEEYDYVSYVRRRIQQAVFTVRDANDTACNEGMIGKTGWDKETLVCASGKEKKIVTCFGDSGGPVLAYILDRWTLVGIVSFGHDTKDANSNKKKCNASLPFYFVRVSAYYDWINEKTNYTIGNFQTVI